MLRRVLGGSANEAIYQPRGEGWLGFTNWAAAALGGQLKRNPLPHPPVSKIYVVSTWGGLRRA